MTEPLTEEDIERIGIEQLRRKERRRSRKGRDKEKEKDTKEKEMMSIKLDWLVKFEEQLCKQYYLNSFISLFLLLFRGFLKTLLLPYTMQCNFVWVIYFDIFLGKKSRKKPGI